MPSVVFRRVRVFDGERRLPVCSVVVTDVSTKGAKLLGRELPRESADVLVSVGNVEVFAKVAWSAGDECGIAFETPLTPELTEHLKREGRWAKVMGVTNAA